MRNTSGYSSFLSFSSSCLSSTDRNIWALNTLLLNLIVTDLIWLQLCPGAEQGIPKCPPHIIKSGHKGTIASFAF